ncbi:MAG: ATP-binding response regulator, partial [Polyangiales bacterium]
PDAVITDASMPVMGGVELCEHLHALDPDLPVVLMTAFGDMQSVVHAMRAGARDYLTKPLQAEAVVSSVLEAIQLRGLKLAKAAPRASRPPERPVPRTVDSPSSVVAVADTDDHVARRDQLARIARELRAVNERLVVNSIREQEHAEEEVRQRAQLAALLGNLSEGVVIADAGGKIRMINEAARRILGLRDRLPSTVDEFNALDARSTDGSVVPAHDRPLSRALRGEGFEERELLRVRPDGDTRRVLASGTNVKDERGHVELAIVVFRDITKLWQLERQREEYTALISHDLRTPLNSIGLLAGTIRLAIAKGAPTEQTAALAERIQRNVTRMAAMVEEILEASSLEAGTIELRRGVCDLRTLVEGMVARLDDARARRVVLEAKDATYTVLGDVPRLDRAITNLVTNALKFSSDGEPVRVVLERSGRDIHVHVVDRGVGMAPEDLARLFERYYRAPSGKATAGIGLGLYISRLLVEAHGGRIHVESTPGKGSSFTVVLPGYPSTT